MGSYRRFGSRWDDYVRLVLWPRSIQRFRRFRRHPYLTAVEEGLLAQRNTTGRWQIKKANCRSGELPQVLLRCEGKYLAADRGRLKAIVARYKEKKVKTWGRLKLHTNGQWACQTLPTCMNQWYGFLRQYSRARDLLKALAWMVGLTHWQKAIMCI